MSAPKWPVIVLKGTFFSTASVAFSSKHLRSANFCSGVRGSVSAGEVLCVPDLTPISAANIFVIQSIIWEDFTRADRLSSMFLISSSMLRFVWRISSSSSESVLWGGVAGAGAVGAVGPTGKFEYFMATYIHDL